MKRLLFVMSALTAGIATVSFASGSLPRYQKIEKCIEVSTGENVSIRKCKGGSDRYVKEVTCRDNTTNEIVDKALCDI